MREDTEGYAKERSKALSATLLCAFRQQYWKLLDLAMKQEGLDVNSAVPTSQLANAKCVFPLEDAIKNLSTYNRPPPPPNPL